MPPRPLSRCSLLLFLPFALLISAAAYAPAPRLSPVAGTMSLVGTPNDHPEKGPGGALVFIGVSKGSNASSGKAAFMDGVDVVSAETTSLVNGNGTHHGVLTMSTGSGTYEGRFTSPVASVIEWKGELGK